MSQDNEIRTKRPPPGRGGARAKPIADRTARADAHKRRGYAALCRAPSQCKKLALSAVVEKFPDAMCTLQGLQYKKLALNTVGP